MKRIAPFDQAWGRALAFGPLVFAATTLTSFSPADAAQLRGHFLGSASGVESNARVGPARSSLNRAAFRSCGCDGTDGKTRTNTLDSLKAGDNGEVATLGKMKASVFTDRTARLAVVKNIAKVDGVNLLDGMITADTIRARTKFKARKRSMRYSLNRSTFVNLKIAGTPVASDVPENTEFDLPGIGKVTVKAVKESGNYSRSGHVRLDMLRIRVKQDNDLNLRVGSVIIVARASAGYSRKNIDQIIGGSAYLAASNGRVGDDAQNSIGKPALLRVGCEGTNGKTRRANFVGVGTNAVFGAGGGQTTGFGGPTRTGVVVKMTSETNDVSLLGGLITSDAVRAVSRDRLKNGTRISSARGTKVLGLKVAGQSIGTVRGRNVEIPVPTVGTLHVNEVRTPRSGSKQLHRVNGLRLDVSSSSAIVPAGSQLYVSHAQSRAY